MSLKFHCARCGRATFSPALFIGKEPIGPTCARLMGFTKDTKLPSAGKVRHAKAPAVPRQKVVQDGQTLDLFEQAELVP